MSEDRETIPQHIKREVRQRCGFGCVICGIPVVHYDHMVEYSVEPEHVADNITLLCPTHHQEKSSGRLRLPKVRRYDADPFALKYPMAGGHNLTYFDGEEFSFALGSNLFTMTSIYGYPSGGAIVVDGVQVLAARALDGEVLVRAVFRDEDNNPLIFIKDNEYRMGRGAWDIRLEGKRLKMWLAEKRIGVNMRFEPSGVFIDRARIYANGYFFEVHPDRDLQVAHSVRWAECHFPGTGIFAGDLRGNNIGNAIYLEEWFRRGRTDAPAFFRLAPEDGPDA